MSPQQFRVRVFVAPSPVPATTRSRPTWKLALRRRGQPERVESLGRREVAPSQSAYLCGAAFLPGAPMVPYPAICAFLISSPRLGSPGAGASGTIDDVPSPPQPTANAASPIKPRLSRPEGASEALPTRIERFPRLSEYSHKSLQWSQSARDKITAPATESVPILQNINPMTRAWGARCAAPALTKSCSCMVRPSSCNPQSHCSPQCSDPRRFSVSQAWTTPERVRPSSKSTSMGPGILSGTRPRRAHENQRSRTLEKQTDQNQ